MQIKTGDIVAIIAGRDQFVTDKKGNKTRKTGRVLKVLREQDRVIVEGVNLVSKHEKPSQANEKGGIIRVEGSIHVSNVALIDPKTNKPTRVSVKEVNGKKVRVSTNKLGNQVLDKVK